MCLKPWFNTKTRKTTPCGGCIGCRQDEMKLWTERARTELKKNDGKGAFVTLTYDTEHLHYHENQIEPSLDREAFKKWLNNFTNQIRQAKALPEGTNRKFKYLAVGEYGGTFQRPHMHIIFTGLDWHDMKPWFKKIWKNGLVDSKPCEIGCIKYVLEYSMKKLKGNLAMKAYDERGVERPFRLVSKGFGADYIKAHAEEINKTGYIKSGTRKIIIPTYYKNLYYRYDAESIQSREAEKLEMIRKKRASANRNGLELTEDIERERKTRQQAEIEKLHRENSPIEIEYINDWWTTSEDILIQAEKLS